MSHLSCSGEQGVDHKQRVSDINWSKSRHTNYSRLQQLATNNSTRSLPDSLGKKKKTAGLFFFFLENQAMPWLSGYAVIVEVDCGSGTGGGSGHVG